DSHVGFESHSKALNRKPEFLPVPILSQDSVLSLTLPGFQRHERFVKNPQGKLVEWKPPTPRSEKMRAHVPYPCKCLHYSAGRSHLIQVWEPGSLLLRVPGSPPPSLYLGRDAEA
ncbi:unnamed protein product, partial [Polarella glacialis]